MDHFHIADNPYLWLFIPAIVEYNKSLRCIHSGEIQAFFFDIS
jgi:hypothetical protein